MEIECYADKSEIKALLQGDEQVLSSLPKDNKTFSQTYFKVIISTKDYHVIPSQTEGYIHVRKKLFLRNL